MMGVACHRDCQNRLMQKKRFWKGVQFRDLETVFYFIYEPLHYNMHLNQYLAMWACDSYTIRPVSLPPSELLRLKNSK
jgi:capsid portal protein